MRKPSFQHPLKFWCCELRTHYYSSSCALVGTRWLCALQPSLANSLVSAFSSLLGLLLSLFSPIYWLLTLSGVVLCSLAVPSVSWFSPLVSYLWDPILGFSLFLLLEFCVPIGPILFLARLCTSKGQIDVGEYAHGWDSGVRFHVKDEKVKCCHLPLNSVLRISRALTKVANVVEYALCWNSEERRLSPDGG